MLLTDARRAARTDDGMIVPVAEQDCSRGDTVAVAEGRVLGTRTPGAGPIGPSKSRPGSDDQSHLVADRHPVADPSRPAVPLARTYSAQKGARTRGCHGGRHEGGRSWVLRTPPGCPDLDLGAAKDLRGGFPSPALPGSGSGDRRPASRPFSLSAQLSSSWALPHVS
ncbi:hypothetical protein [Dactylosporangium sp. NBC_01737]|uniref:hypothetical protein n=1 Tax=Dactylosporangium sp. NBC_01737 TaxID=2975959 RepID=UPI003FA3DAA9